MHRDKAVWKLKKDGIFTVKSFYHYLANNEGERVRFPDSQIWKVRAPPRITFFAWEAVQECILTIDKLMRRGHILVSGCYLCMEAVESCNHLLLWCPVTYSLWNIVHSLLGINWIIGGTVKNELWVWDEICKKLKFIKLIPSTIFWVV